MPRITFNDLRDTIAQATSNVKKQFEAIESNIYENGNLQSLMI